MGYVLLRPISSVDFMISANVTKWTIDNKRRHLFLVWGSATIKRNLERISTNYSHRNLCAVLRIRVLVQLEISRLGLNWSQKVQNRYFANNKSSSIQHWTDWWPIELSPLRNFKILINRISKWVLWKIKFDEYNTIWKSRRVMLVVHSIVIVGNRHWKIQSEKD